MTTNTSAKSRIAALKKLLEAGLATTQEEICDELHKMNFDITQSTVSRDLRRLGAARLVNPSGETIYKLPNQLNPSKSVSVTDSVSSGLLGLIKDIKHNGYIIVIHTTPGSASLIAKHIDDVQPNGILGTIAGDDTIFVIPSAKDQAENTIQAIQAEFEKN
ncbi:MAG: arginine repressor [Moraxellaceae bacterium]|nr:arginine repressor [Pseudobdellovibrionaceae bacterium]